jgi:prepilin-type N-terminal cleavage/methylation domain-containing protein
MIRRAFTLVELLVVIAIIGLLSTVAIVSMNSSKVNARNTKRKADMVQITKALEVYYSDNGAYPSTGGGWRGVCNGGGSFTVGSDSGAGGWIPNLAPTYMATLPRDVNTGKANPSSANATCQSDGNYSCYIYISNGRDYKLLAHCTPEGAMSASDPFYEPTRPTWAWSIYSSGGVVY